MKSSPWWAVLVIPQFTYLWCNYRLPLNKAVTAKTWILPALKTNTAVLQYRRNKYHHNCKYGLPSKWYRQLSIPPRKYHQPSILFSYTQIEMRKAGERALATLDEKSTSSGIDEPYARWKLKARTGGEKGRHLWPRLVQTLESKRVWEKKKKISTAVPTRGQNTWS